MKRYDFLKIYKPLNELVDDIELFDSLVKNGFSIAKDILNMDELEIQRISKNKLKAKKLKNIIKEVYKITTFLKADQKATYNLNNEYFLDYDIIDFYNLETVNHDFLKNENIKTISDMYTFLDKPVSVPKIKRANIILKEIEKIKISELNDIKNEHVLFLDLWNSLFKISPIIDNKIGSLIAKNNSIESIKTQKIEIISLYIEYHLKKSNILTKIDEFNEIIKDFEQLKEEVLKFLSNKIEFINEFIKLKKPSIKQVDLINLEDEEYKRLYDIVFGEKEIVPDTSYYLNKFKLINKKMNISFDEEYFVYLNNTYDIKNNELKDYFYLNEMQVYYIDSFSISKTTRASIDEAIDDDLIPNDWKRKIEQIIFKSRHYLDLPNGKYIKNNKRDILEFIITNFAQDYIHIDEIHVHYQRIVNESSLSDDAKERTLKDLKLHDIESILQRMECVILNLNKKYRYYSLIKYNFDHFLEELNLEQYEDSIFSTSFFMKKFPKLMEEYDIRNEYDLHNILKKVLQNKLSKINFGRMPIIKIGTPNEEEQILNFLRELKKCYHDEFFEKYSEKFGFHKASAISNYSKYLEKYFSNGYYSIESGKINTNIDNFEFQKLKNELKKDFYTKEEFLEEAKNILNKEVLINQYLCKQIEFNELDGYLYRSFGSKNILGVIQYHLNNCEKFEIKSYLESLGFSKEYFKTNSFNSAIAELKRNFEIIKVENKNIFSSFNTINKNTGIKKEEIIDFCEKSKEFTNNESLTYYELLEHGFQHPLIKYNMSDTFYKYLIDWNNSFGKNIDLKKNEIKTNETNKESTIEIEIKEQNNEITKNASNSREVLILLNFLTSWFIENEEDPISIDVLKRNIQEQFNIEINEKYIIELLSVVPFYYHNKLGLIFKDKNTYLKIISEY
ncbi:RNA polymerase subunit alpha domain-containing protein [Mycoplasmopsis canis UFG1]|uniref:hypothetical protein n=1 Tax=Mycoplasmopsis canis TaxID=29555 RepID=UPI00025B001A|nr:hypothetical protein [Mycoplasmopsis canis]EIE41607.1 RNA polymerase subunit alpha domain-containing protein [Mycoplasmopsis canis UFG1]